MGIKGAIYILTNPSFEQFVKIGYADNVNDRIDQLNRSECVPYAFRLYAYYEVPERLTDLKLHQMIDNINPELRTIENFNGKKRVREFYAMRPEDAFNILDTIATLSGSRDKLHLVKPSIDQVIDEEDAQEKNVEERLPRMNWMFEQELIKTGDKVYITKYPEKIAEVINYKYVSYNNKQMTFNEFGLEVTGWQSIQIYVWMKKVGCDKTLDELRKEGLSKLVKKTSDKQMGVEEITKYLVEFVDNAQKSGKEYIDVKASDIHKQLKLDRRFPSVCSAMRKTKKILGIDAEVIVDVPKHNGCIYTIRYKFK